jgi:hypothetical protein
VCLCVVCLQFARTGVFCLKKNDRPFGQKHRKTVRCGGASLKAIDIRMGAPPTEYLASSTKVRDDVCDVMLGAYALARHGNRGAGHACVCVCVCVWIKTCSAGRVSLASRARRTGRYCAHASLLALADCCEHDAPGSLCKCSRGNEGGRSPAVAKPPSVRHRLWLAG